MMPVALTVAGSDPSGGAGIQADLKTFHQFRVYGEAVITLITVQNTRTVSRVELLSPELIREQIEAVLTDIPPGAVKTGALGTAGIIETVADALRGVRLVVDPVMISKHGAPLLADDAVDALVRRLLPRAAVVTPNLAEASRMTGLDVHDAPGMERAARAIAAMGPRHVLVKGGHLEGEALDVLLSDGAVHRFVAPRIDTVHTHGTGCVLSASITARLARGESVPDAVAGAQRFVRAAIEGNPGLGGGCGPVDLFADTGDAR
jgi:hydroxymethylpyrimidine/phosphomethylpyrimidine kinase